MTAPPGNVRTREALLIALYAALHVATALAFVLRRDPGTDAAWVGFPLDDSWIHHVYARSISEGGFFEYVPGQPEAGFTSPLWALLVAPLYWMTRDPHGAAVLTKGLGVLVGIGTSVVGDRLARALSGVTWLGMLAGVAIALDPLLTFSEVSGMEVPLVAGLLAGMLLAWVEKRFWLTGILGGLALVTRPEAALVPLLVAGAEAYARRDALRKRERPALEAIGALLAPSLVLGGAWSAFCLSVTGRPLPNTFYAKHHPENLIEVVRDFPRIFGPQLFDMTWFFAGAGVVLWALAGVAITRRLGRTPQAIAILVGPLVFLLGIAWAHDVPFVRAFATLRYSLPPLVWLIALFAVGAGEAITRVRAARSDATRRSRGIALASALAIALPLCALPPRFLRAAETYAWNCQNIEEMQVAIALWLRDRTREDEWIATHDAGAIRLFSDRRVLDLAGLNEHRVFEVGALLLGEVEPRYFVVFPDWFPHLVASPRYRTVYSARAERYTICPCTTDELLVLEPVSASSP
jgi:hypothetical protein